MLNLQHGGFDRSISGVSLPSKVCKTLQFTYTQVVYVQIRLFSLNQTSLMENRQADKKIPANTPRIEAIPVKQALANTKNMDKLRILVQILALYQPH